MTNAAWPLTEFAARLLEPADRDAVLGDLEETGQTGWNALKDVLGLVFLQQVLLWKSSRPWLVGFGVALPVCYLLMGVSASISCTYERLYHPMAVEPHWPTGHEGVLLLLCHVLLLIAWSWVAGFVCGALSGRTVWITVALCLFLFFFDDFHIEPLPKACLLLYLLPLLTGVRHGLRATRIQPAVALLLAGGVTGLMLFCWNNGALWILNWALLLPAWYVVAVTLRANGRAALGGAHLVQS